MGATAHARRFGRRHVVYLHEEIETDTCKRLAPVKLTTDSLKSVSLAVGYGRAERDFAVIRKSQPSFSLHESQKGKVCVAGLFVDTCRHPVPVWMQCPLKQRIKRLNVARVVSVTAQ